MVLLKNVMPSKITNLHANIFDILALRIRLAFFYHFKNTPKRKQASLIYDEIYSEHTRRVGEANTLTYKYIFNQNV